MKRVNIGKKTVWEKTKIQNLLKNGSSGVYYARFSVAGKSKKQQVWKSLRTKSYSVAKLKLIDLRKAELKRRAAFSDLTTGKLDVGSLVIQYEERTQNDPDLKPSTVDARLKAVKRILKTWPGICQSHVRSVTKRDCIEWGWRLKKEGTRFIQPRAKRVNPKPLAAKTVNATIDCLREIFEQAVENGIIYENPARAIKKSKVVAKRINLPKRAQFREIIEVIAASGAAQALDCAEMVEFLCLTGARKGEGTAVTWACVDWENNRIRIPGTKTAASYRIIPMIPSLQAFMERLRERRREEPETWPVIRIKECQGALTRACRMAGCQRLTHHDLRHFFATICIESGVDIPTVSRWLGHSDGGVLAMKTYGHLRDEHSTHAAKKVTFDPLSDSTDGDGKVVKIVS